MSLSDLASIGSFISGVAVLVSFVFLAFQLRQNARNQRATIHNERTALTQQLTLQITDSDGAMDTWLRGSAADETLPRLQANRYLFTAIATFWAYEEFFYQHRDGMIDEARWSTNVRRLRSMIAFPGYRAAWLLFSANLFESDFARWVNDIKRDTPVLTEVALNETLWKEFARRELAGAKAGPLAG